MRTLPCALASLFVVSSAYSASVPSVTTNFSIPYGIQYDTVSLSDLAQNGCRACYSRLYSDPTTTSSLDSCAGPVLFVGARVDSSSTFTLGAYGHSVNVLSRTSINTPHLSNGVYWYLTPFSSFGFLRDNNLVQSSADIGLTFPESRLSWHLDQYVGGYRAGEAQPFDASWWKAVYSCAGSISPSPSASPVNTNNPQAMSVPTVNRSLKPSIRPSLTPTLLRPTPSISILTAIQVRYAT